MDKNFKVKETGSITTLKGIALGGSIVTEKDFPVNKRAERIKRLLATKMISEVKKKVKNESKWYNYRRR